MNLQSNKQELVIASPYPKGRWLVKNIMWKLKWSW